ncbi:diphosphoinositol polyphosphate phosphohydrolase 3-alpha-like [Rhynchocyon petersi]
MRPRQSQLLLASTAPRGGGWKGSLSKSPASLTKFMPNQRLTGQRLRFRSRGHACASCACRRCRSWVPDPCCVPDLNGGMEPGRSPRVCCLEGGFRSAGKKGKLGRSGTYLRTKIDRKHRTGTIFLQPCKLWEESVSTGRAREWFQVEDATVLQHHKSVHAEYLDNLQLALAHPLGILWSLPFQTRLPGL